MANKNTYESPEIVERYATQTNLYRHEEAILNFLKPNLKNMRVLDVGVGAGRTTIHLASLCKEYTGIDYSKEMIEACQKRFSNSLKNTNFQLSDVRSMTTLKDNSFDFVFVSANGLDYISHEDRLTSLKEIKRVLKPNGHFSFSTHNLNNVDDLFAIESKHPVTLTKNIKKFIRCNNIPILIALTRFNKY